MQMVLGNNSYDLGPKVKIKGQMMYSLINASPPKPLDVTPSNVLSAYVS